MPVFKTCFQTFVFHQPLVIVVVIIVLRMVKQTTFTAS